MFYHISDPRCVSLYSSNRYGIVVTVVLSNMQLLVYYIDRVISVNMLFLL
jgi:hypothetical protein